jgi:hypothetical protein
MAPPSLIHEPIRKLPLCQDGFAHGQDVGLRLALDALTAERGRQEQHAIQHPESSLTYVYAAGCLLDVSKVIAGTFRQR